MSNITRTFRSSLRWQCLNLRKFSTTPVRFSSPAVLPRLREDLKTAMRSKDTVRLSVLRSILADITNASKTSSPIASDLQLLTLLKKRSASSRAAAEEFRAAKREDIAEKEEVQVAIMEEYAGQVETVSEEEIRAAVDKVVKKLKGEGGKVVIGDVLKDVMAGALAGKPVERGEVVKIVKGALGS